MSDSQWDQKLQSFLKKTSEDFRRFGTDIQQEANKLLREVQDPERQRKVKEGLAQVGDWAKKTADDLAVVIEDGVKKAGSAVGTFINQPGATPPAGRPAPATPPSPPPPRASAPPPPRKTVGRAAPKKKPAAKGTAKKTIGRKKS